MSNFKKGIWHTRKQGLELRSKYITISAAAAAKNAYPMCNSKYYEKP